MIRSLILTGAAAGLLLSSTAAQEPAENFSLKDYPQRTDEAVAACEANMESAECRVYLRSVLPGTMDALTYLGYHSSYAEAAPLLREMAAFPVPQVQAAALYALARLTPTSADLPTLREALLSDVPAVRRAALGALKLLPETAAQELAGRSPRMPSGGNYEADGLPFVPADMGLASWPQGSRYLHFQRRYDSGAYAFIASVSTADMVALFEAQAGTRVVGMGEIEARYGAAYADPLKPYVERNQSLGAVQAIVLKAPDTPSERDPVVIAFVYEDYALGAPGFAIQRLPGEDLPYPRVAAATEAPKPTGDAAIWYGAGKFVPKEGAAPDDVAAWRAVLEANGWGAADYLATFPNGAYRTEAEAYLAGPKITTDQDVYAETDTVRVTWSGLPDDVSADLRLSPAGAADIRDSVAMDNPDIRSGSGSTELHFYPVVEPGVYELRIVDASDEPLATQEIRIAVAQAEVKLAKDSYKPGEEIVIQFAGLPGLDRDAITIARKDEAPDRQGAVVAATNGAKDGTLTLAAPEEPGAYEVRAWFGRDRRVRARVPFAVRGPDLPPEFAGAPTGPAMAIAAASFVANETIAIRYAGFSGSTRDYIAIAVPGSPPNAYLTYAYTKGGTDGLMELKLPPEPGTYELRAFFEDRADAAKATAPITLTAPAGTGIVTLALPKTNFAPGETIAIDFANMSGESGNYVAVAGVGARYRSYLSYVRTQKEKAGRAELKAPAQPGTYEIRAFFNDDADILRGAVTFTVGAP